MLDYIRWLRCLVFHRVVTSTLLLPLPPLPQLKLVDPYRASAEGPPLVVAKKEVFVCIHCHLMYGVGGKRLGKCFIIFTEGP